MAFPEYEKLARISDRPQQQAFTNLPLVEASQATGEVAELYAYFRAHFGRPDIPGILKCFATHPPLLRHMMALSESLIFSDGHLTRRHKEMIATLISTRNRCPYCADSHGYFLRVHGGSAESLRAIQESRLDSPALTSPEQALLAFAAKINEGSAEIRPSDIESLRTHGWTNSQIAEAIHVASLFATFNRVANAFGLASQDLLALYEQQSSPAE